MMQLESNQKEFKPKKKCVQPTSLHHFYFYDLYILQFFDQIKKKLRNEKKNIFAPVQKNKLKQETFNFGVIFSRLQFSDKIYCCIYCYEHFTFLQTY